MKITNGLRIEILRAGCPACEAAIKLVNSISYRSCEIVMHKDAATAKAKQYGARSEPAIVVDGKLAGWCAGPGVDEVSPRVCP
ncbi:MAG TPA: thioredoxin family protein [Pyrinomonadaceae bacterium]